MIQIYDKKSRLDQLKDVTDRTKDLIAANKAGNHTSIPAGYTWHHHHECGRMQLVETAIHRQTPHIAGFAMWGKNDSDLLKEQASICKKYDTGHIPPPLRSIVCISFTTWQDTYPIHGLRYPNYLNNNGWCIWTGEVSEEPDFFKCVPVKHLYEYCPIVLKYLGLGARWSFSLTPDDEDVWLEDESSFEDED